MVSLSTRMVILEVWFPGQSCQLTCELVRNGAQLGETLGGGGGRRPGTLSLLHSPGGELLMWRWAPWLQHCVSIPS